MQHFLTGRQDLMLAIKVLCRLSLFFEAFVIVTPPAIFLGGAWDISSCVCGNKNRIVFFSREVRPSLAAFVLPEVGVLKET